MGMLGCAILIPGPPGLLGVFQAGIYAGMTMYYPTNVVVGAGRGVRLPDVRVPGASSSSSRAASGCSSSAGGLRALEEAEAASAAAPADAAVRELGPGARASISGGHDLGRSEGGPRGRALGRRGERGGGADGGGASAKSTYESPYGYDRTWNAALRLVRVDNGWKVTEKDDQNGYLLFDYKSPEGGKPYPGTLELVRGRDPDGAGERPRAAPGDAAVPRAGPARRAGHEDAPRVRRPARSHRKPVPQLPDAADRRAGD